MDNADLGSNLVEAQRWNEGLNGVYAAFLKPGFEVVLLCRESKHTKGYVSKGCLRCTAPICDACVVKDAYGKQEATHRNRRRHVCAECWSRDEHLIMQPSVFQSKRQTSYAKCAESREFCQCTVHDGWLCSECKIEQNSNLATKLEQCATAGCPDQPLNNYFGGRVCLWCDLPMPGRISLAEARREYDSLHLRARAFHACEPLSAVDPETGCLRLRHGPNTIFQGREDSQKMLDSQRLPAPMPSLFRADSAAAPPMRERQGKDRFKREASLLRRIGVMVPSYRRRRDSYGQEWPSAKEKWRSSSTSLLIRHPTSDDTTTPYERPSVILYEGP